MDVSVAWTMKPFGLHNSLCDTSLTGVAAKLEESNGCISRSDNEAFGLHNSLCDTSLTGVGLNRIK